MRSQMNKNEYIKELNEAFEANGLGDLLDEDKSSRLYQFSLNLVESNKQFNLTAITDEHEIIIKHFIDCASIASLLDQGSTVIDVGCGAGFPSTPIAILRPDLRITALDSTLKRINFVNEQARILDLSNLSGVCARAEDYAESQRESFDYCVSRAVARLNVLAEICIPLVKLGGKFIAMKGQKCHEELEAAQKTIEACGGELSSLNLIKLTYQDIDETRSIFEIQKILNTPSKYPRQYAKIVKSPL
jgi:16S rRNA (guanine527-N7)-methyltransferase